jgi:DNA-binding PadR family transcriptional regulator
MSARHTLLGLLAEGPAHGYLLRKRLRAKLGPAWEINSGQVSQNLGRLEQEGFVRAVNGESAPRGRKRVVELTESGAVELDGWFERDTAGVRVSSPEFLAKVNLGGPERCEESLAHITTYESDCVQRLEELRERRDSVPIWPVVTAERMLRRCAAICEMLQVEAHLQGAMLARETIAVLKDNGALWGVSSAQSDANAVRAREQAREDIFGRMAKSHLDALPGEQDATQAE